MTDSEGLNIAIAVSLASAGSISSAIGYVVQKKGHNEVQEINQDKPEDQQTSYVKNCKWITGFAVYVLGSIFNAAALKFGAQSVVAPLGALTLVANTILAAKFLGEPFTMPNDLIGVALVVLGSVLAVIFGPKSEGDDPTVDELQSLAATTRFSVFFWILTGLTLADFIAVKFFERKNFVAKNNKEIKHGAKFLMISYVSIAAYFGSTNVLFMKAIVLILSDFSVDTFKSWIFYFVLIGTILVNVLLEFFRQRALAYFGAILVVPIYQVLLIVGSAMMGAMFFNEFAGLEAYELILFIIAILVTMSGVAVMAFNIGKYFDKVDDVVQVAFIEAGEVLTGTDDNEVVKVAFPVWGGLWSRIVQDYYVQSTAFFINSQLEKMAGLASGVATGVGRGVDEMVEVVTHKKKNKGTKIGSNSEIDNGGIR